MSNEFLHCNACFAYLTSSTAQETQIRFWLTECGHVICLPCLNKHGETSQENSSTTTEHICPVCNAKCAAVELTDQLPPNLNMFFRPAYEIMDETADVLRFQQTNTFSLLRFLKDKVAKQKQLLDKAKDELLQYKDTK
ncbi:15376_t:CDS:2, partial [Dentiscutata heterogama]